MLSLSNSRHFPRPHRHRGRLHPQAAPAAPDNIAVLGFDQEVRPLQRLLPCIDPELATIGDRIRRVDVGSTTYLAPALKHANAIARTLPIRTLRICTIIADGEFFDVPATLSQADEAKANWMRINAILVGDSSKGAEQLRQVVGRTVNGAFSHVSDYRELTAAVLATHKRNHGRVAAHIVLVDLSPSMTLPLPGTPKLRRLDGAAAAIEQFVTQHRHLHG